MKNNAIGIIDSGLGGLSIWSSIQKLFPNESTMYLADHAWAPYGDKSDGVITERVKTLIRYLIDRSCKLIVIACNTATVAGIDQYRLWFPHIPIVGVVPVIKMAAATSKTRTFAVLSTVHTANSDYQKRLIDTFANGCTVYSVGCPHLVELIESGKTKGPVVEKIVSNIFKDRDPKIDTIVLGCTHFPFLHEAIRAIVGEGTRVLDSGGAVARQVGRVLQSRGEVESNGGTFLFYTTGNPKKVSRVAGNLMDRVIEFSNANL